MYSLTSCLWYVCALLSHGLGLMNQVIKASAVRQAAGDPLDRRERADFEHLNEFNGDLFEAFALESGGFCCFEQD